MLTMSGMDADVRASEGMAMRFGGRQGSAEAQRVQGSVEPVFLTPPVQGPGALEDTDTVVEVYIGGERAGSVEFKYREPAEVQSVSPTFGPLRGSTVIAVRGQHFRDDGGLVCGFFNSDSAATETARTTSERVRWVTSSVVECTTPPSISSLRVLVEVSNNGVDFTSGGMQYLYEAGPTVTAVKLHSATMGDAGSHTVAVTGRHFAQSPLLTCSVGSYSAWMSSSLVLCTVDTAWAGNMTVEVSNNGQDFSTDGVEYQGASGLGLSAQVQVRPSSGPANGGTLVTLSGKDWQASEDVQCAFTGGAVTTGELVEEVGVVCRTPRQTSPDEGTVDIRVLVDGEEVSQGSELRFEYEAPAVVVGVVPSAGAVEGSTMVQVMGSGFKAGAGLGCMFAVAGTDGRVMMEGRWETSSVMTCMSPRAGSEQTVSVEVSNNGGADLTSSDVKFTFFTAPVVQQIFPSLVPSSAYSVITVVGSSFIAEQLSLRILDSEFRCENSSSMICHFHIHPLDPGNYSLLFSVHGQEFLTPGQRLSVFNSPIVTSLSSSIAPVWSPVSISGEGHNLDGLKGGYCSFGDYQTRFVFLDPNGFTCPSPRVSEPGVVEFQVCSSSSHCYSRFSFSFVRLPVIATSAARYGWCTGDLQVDIYGKDFGAFECVFSQGSGRAYFAPKILSSSHVLCATKVQQFEAGPRTIELSQDHLLTLVHNATCISDTSPAVTGVTPQRMVSVHNSATITVVGRNFVDTTQLACRVGSHTSSARFLSTSRLLCSALGSLLGNQTVEVSLDGSHFTRDGMTISLSPAQCSFRLVPSMGVLTGGTVCKIVQIEESKLDGLTFGSGGTVVPVSENGLVTTPPSSTAGKDVKVQAYFSGLPSDCSTVFHYTERVYLKTILPSSCSDQGGASITLVGSNFGSHCHVQIESQRIPSRMATSSFVVCTSPAHPVGSVTLSYDCADHDSNMILHIHKLPKIDLIEPNEVFIPGDRPVAAQIVTVTGQHFVDGQSLSCKLGNQVLSTQWITSTNIVCVATLVRAGNTSISVSNNGVEFSVEKPFSIQLTSAAVQNVFPSSGPSRTPLIVTIAGVGFNSARNWLCSDDTFRYSYQAGVVSDSLISCAISVEPSFSGVFRFGIGHSGLILSRHEIVIRSPPQVAQINPSAGGGGRGTLVHVHGEFLEGAAVECIFTDAAAPAVVISSTLLRCISPMISHTAHFSVRVDGLEAEQTREFWYVPIPVLESITPGITFYSGENKVQILGSDFKDLETLTCKIGEKFTSRAVYHTDQRVSCRVPRMGIRNISVAISNNGQDFSPVLTLQVIQAPSIHSIYPSAGPSQGGVMVRLHVRDLNPKLTPYYADIRCRFGWTDVAAAVQNSGNSVLCAAPGQMEDSTVQVTIVENGLALVNNSVNFTFLSAPTIHSIVPSLGPLRGSTEVTLSITNFNASVSSHCVCFFGDKSSAVRTDMYNASVVCKSPAAPKSGIFRVSVFCNGFDIHGPVAFEYLDDLIIEGFYPSTGEIPSQTMVTIFGYGFQKLDTLSCKFGENGGKSTASHLSSTTIKCQSRPQIPGNATVTLSYNGVDWIKAPHPFLAMSKSTAVSLEPTFGTMNGGTMVTVRGYPIRMQESQFCTFGTKSVRMTSVSSSVGRCLSPAGNVGFVNFFLENELSKDRAGPTKFEYVSHPHLDSLIPSTGRLMGGTLVSIFGKNFQRKDTLSCRFGNILVIGSFVNSDVMLCRSPRHPSRYAEVDVTINGQDFTRSGIKYLYDDIKVESIYPLSGPLSGGSRVHIRTKNLLHSNTLTCRVGGVKIQMQRASAFEAWCVTPPSQAEGFVEISVSSNEQEYMTSGVRFEYQSVVHIVSLAPSFGSLHGNSRIAVMGSGFIDGKSLTCRFGTVSRAVHRFISSQQIECFTPPSDIGTVVVQVANNAVDFAPSKTLFEYRRALEVHYIEPSSGHMQGSTAVTFVGLNFQNTASFGCRFGAVVVKAEWISEVRGFCSSPRPTFSGLHHFEVTSNGVDFTESGVNFQYFESVRITSVYPTIAPASSGQALVTVNVLSADLAAFPSWKCVFGSLKLAVPAVVVSSERLQCVAPRSAVSEVPLRLTRNFQNLEGDHGHSFQFVEDTTLLGLKPNSGLTDGGTTVFLFGTNIRNSSSLECRFGSASTPATFLSKFLAICRSPAQAPGSVDVELSNSRASWTRSRLLYTYLRCPKGSFCPGKGVLLPCPPGSYCDQDRQVNHTLCPPSTYQPSSGKTACLQCPLGRFCADEGLIAPGILCPPGYVCESIGLRVPEKPCPPGHFCLEGTLTSDPTNRKTRNKPYECPAGFYCTYGVMTPVSEASNFSTPQPCIPGYFCSSGSETPHGQGPCPSGYHCPTYAPGVAKICGPGTFCPGVANTMPLHCNPGTTNNLYGQIKCGECPRGTVCPDYAMKRPKICPAGFVCDKEGLAVWSKQCPPGYFCGEGTLTSNATSLERPRPNKCAPGTFCLIGVKTNVSVPGNLATPQPCAEGTYCWEATGSQFGTAPCEPGTVCPTGSSAPLAAPMGHYAKRRGMSAGIPCLPGTYAANNGTIECRKCPAGYQCGGDGVIFPKKCPPGTYREATDGIACMLCPEGMWSREYGISSRDLCEPCPAGVVCGVDGMSSMKLASPCPEGYVCKPGTTASSQFEEQCPAGFYCDFGTKPSTQFDTPCEAGFGCPAGTSYSQRKRYRCSEGYFCPPGSTSGEPKGSQCPVGTTSKALAQTVHDCYKDVERFDSICHISPYYDDPFDVCLLAYKCSKTTSTFEAYSKCKKTGLLDANYIFTDMLQNEVTVNENFFKGQAMSVIRVSLDWRIVPIDMKFLDHFQLVFNQFNVTSGIKLHEIRPGFKGTWFGEKSVDKHGILTFNVICLRETYFRFDVEMLHGLYIENKNYSSFRDTVKFEVLRSRRALLDASVPVQFYILLPRTKLISPPLNLVPPEAVLYEEKDERFGNQQKYRFVNKLEPLVDFAGDNESVPLYAQAFADKGGEAGLNMVLEKVWPTRETFEHSHYVLPYLPYFSSCRGFDSHMPLFMLLESEENCNLIEYNSTVWVDQWNPFTTATAVEIDSAMDTCQWNIECMYEEEIEKVSTVPRWFELKPGITLFYITRDPHPYEKYADAYAGDNPKALAKGLEFFTEKQATSEMVPVIVTESLVPIDERTRATGVPRSVTLTIKYYQRSQTRKRIIVAGISFDDYSAKEQNGKIVRDFNLLVEYRAMDYLSLLNGFSFDPPIYLILFLIAGTGCMEFYTIFWAFQRVFTRLQRPPKLAIWAYLRTILAPVRGCILAFVPCCIIFAVIHGLFRSLSYPIFSDFNELYTDFESGSQWTNTARTSVATMLGVSASRQVEQGRLAIAVVTFGLYLCLTAALAFIPGREERGEKGIMSLFDPKSLALREDEKRDDENSVRLKRIDGWYRTQYLLACMLAVLANTVVLEFSFSTFFQRHLYQSIVAISIGFSLEQSFLIHMLGDSLLVQPMVISSNVIETIVLMGSPDFLEFIQLFIFQLLFKTAMRVYLLPGVQNAKDLVAYLGAVLRRQQEKRDREEDLEEGEELDDDDDVLNEVEFEGFSPAENIIQMFAAYSSELIALLAYPLIILFIWWGEGIQLAIGSHYGVRTTDFVYYVLFAITVIPFRLVCDTLVHASQELFHGWKILDYLKYCAHRFGKRSERWRGLETEEDESLREHLRMVDLMCFSSQYYFVISIGAYGCLMLMFGFELLARNYHNPFSDKMTFPVAFFVLLLIWVRSWFPFSLRCVLNVKCSCCAIKISCAG